MITSLQALRWFAIFAIFLSHLNFFEKSEYALLYQYLFFSGGPVGVSIFIILSGFVITINYYNKTSDLSFTNAKRFTLKRIQKFYKLHILTLLLALPFAIAAIVKNYDLIFNNLIKLLLNLLLLQSFVPMQGVYFSCNAVSWYLSTSLLFYLCTYFIFKLLHKMVTGGGDSIYFGYAPYMALKSCMHCFCRISKVRTTGFISAPFLGY